MLVFELWILWKFTILAFDLTEIVFLTEFIFINYVTNIKNGKTNDFIPEVEGKQIGFGFYLKF